MAQDGSLWCGTYNDGLIHYDERTGQTERFDSSSGLTSTNVKSVIEDNEGNIWFSTAQHISKFDRRSRTFSTLHDDRFSGGRFYDLVSCAKGPDGKLYFGGTGGITVIDPAVEMPAREDTPLNFEYLAVNGTQIPAGTGPLRLSWRENTLTLRFSGLDFESGSQLNYSYRLEGLERDWQYRTNDVQATYTQLPAGHYVFLARVREPDGRWGASPAPWFSWWALLFYILFGLALAAFALRAYIRIRMQRSQLAVAKQHEEMKQQHIDFVTNISHEFRTPLSMIYGPVKELSKHPLDEQDRRLVDTIARNAERLKRSTSGRTTSCPSSAQWRAISPTPQRRSSRPCSPTPRTA